MILGVEGNVWDKKVNKIQNVTDEGILAIAKGCKKLKQLNLNHCEMITDQSLQHLVENDVKLASLEIFGCTKISIEGVIKGIQFTMDSAESRSTWKSVTLNMNETKVRSNTWKEFEKSIASKDLPKLNFPKKPRTHFNTPWKMDGSQRPIALCS